MLWFRPVVLLFALSCLTACATSFTAPNPQVFGYDPPTTLPQGRVSITLHGDAMLARSESYGAYGGGLQLRVGVLEDERLELVAAANGRLDPGRIDIEAERPSVYQLNGYAGFRYALSQRRVLAVLQGGVGGGRGNIGAYVAPKLGASIGYAWRAATLFGTTQLWLGIPIESASIECFNGRLLFDTRCEPLSMSPTFGMSLGPGVRLPLLRDDAEREVLGLTLVASLGTELVLPGFRGAHGSVLLGAGMAFSATF